MVFVTISYSYLSVEKDYHMSEHNQKNLTLSNRTYIEQELFQKSTFSSIGEVLHKNPSTISKEVKRYYKTVTSNYYSYLDITLHIKSRKVRYLCGFPAFCLLLELGVFFVAINCICLSFMQIHACFYFNYIIYYDLPIFCCQNVATHLL